MDETHSTFSTKIYTALPVNNNRIRSEGNFLFFQRRGCFVAKNVVFYLTFVTPIPRPPFSLYTNVHFTSNAPTRVSKDSLRTAFTQFYGNRISRTNCSAPEQQTVTRAYKIYWITRASVCVVSPLSCKRRLILYYTEFPNHLICKLLSIHFYRENFYTINYITRTYVHRDLELKRYSCKTRQT